MQKALKLRHTAALSLPVQDLPDPSEASPHPRQMTPNLTSLQPKLSLSMLSVLLLDERLLKRLKLGLPLLFPPLLTPGIIVPCVELGLPGTS